MDGEITLTMNSVDKKYQYADFGVTFESTDQEIVDALSPLLEEEEGFNLAEEYRDQAYTIKRADNSRNVYIFPKSVAG